jgi:hypothetical protein
MEMLNKTMDITSHDYWKYRDLYIHRMRCECPIIRHIRRLNRMRDDNVPVIKVKNKTGLIKNVRVCHTDREFRIS